MKKKRFQDALDKLPSMPGEDLLEFIRATHYAMRQGEGMSWNEIITMVEAKTGDNLDNHRPPKCEKCGGGLYRNGKCDSYTCENSMWLKR
jgi:hypothetical protein